MAKKKREFKKSFAELPEPIIQHILSFLPEEDAAQTSILCKAWLNAWRTKPNLEFNSELFFGKKSEIHSMESREKKKRRKKFSKYTKRTLKRYSKQKISIEALKLNAGKFGDYSPMDSLLFKRCTRVAVERGVKNLSLFGSGCADELPQIIVGAKSLVDLKLIGLNMLHLSKEKLMWNSLKQLRLYSLHFDEAMFENIISSCPLLEILKIYDVYKGFYDVDDYEFDNEVQFKVIEHHKYLKEFSVTLYPYQRLILGEAPKLESLVCTIHEEYLEDGGDLITCGLSLHSSQYQNLKMLHLLAVSINDDFFNNFEQKFPHLEDLSVEYCQDLRRIIISSQTLRNINLEENYELEEAHFDVPSMERLEYKCEECEIIPEFSFTSTKDHWKSSYIKIDWRGNVDSSWFLQLKKFLVNLIPSNITLEIEIGGRIEMDMNEIRNSSTFREPQELQELILSLSPGLDSSSILTALEGFFSIFRPNIISQYWIERYKNVNFMKLLYNMLMLKTNQHQHHRSHDLRQIKVQMYDCDVVLERSKTEYFTKGLAYKQPEPLNLKSILKALKNRGVRSHGDKNRVIHFILKWKKQRMSKGKERRRRDRMCLKKQKN